MYPQRPQALACPLCNENYAEKVPLTKFLSSLCASDPVTQDRERITDAARVEGSSAL
jgi:hypothetical protein